MNTKQCTYRIQTIALGLFFPLEVIMTEGKAQEPGESQSYETIPGTEFLARHWLERNFVMFESYKFHGQIVTIIIFALGLK